MDIKLKDLKKLIWNAGLLNYRLFNMVNRIVNVDRLQLLWETTRPKDWTDIGGKKYNDYYVQEIQTNIPNTIDILISKNPGIDGDILENE